MVDVAVDGGLIHSVGQLVAVGPDIALASAGEGLVGMVALNAHLYPPVTVIGFFFGIVLKVRIGLQGCVIAEHMVHHCIGHGITGGGHGQGDGNVDVVQVGLHRIHIQNGHTDLLILVAKAQIIAVYRVLITDVDHNGLILHSLFGQLCDLRIHQGNVILLENLTGQVPRIVSQVVVQLVQPSGHDQPGLVIQPSAAGIDGRSTKQPIELLIDLTIVLVVQLILKVLLGIVRLHGAAQHLVRLLGGGVYPELSISVVLKAVVEHPLAEVTVGEGDIGSAGLSLVILVVAAGQILYVIDFQFIQIDVHIHIVDDDRVLSGTIASAGGPHHNMEHVGSIVQVLDRQVDGMPCVIDLGCLTDDVSILILQRDQDTVFTHGVDNIFFPTQVKTGRGFGGLDLQGGSPGSVIHQSGSLQLLGLLILVEHQIPAIHTDEVQPLVKGILSNHSIIGLAAAAVPAHDDGHPRLRTHQVDGGVGGVELIGDIAADLGGIAIGQDGVHRYSARHGIIAEQTLGHIGLAGISDIQAEGRPVLSELGRQVSEGSPQGHRGSIHIKDQLFVDIPCLDLLQVLGRIIGGHLVQPAADLTRGDHDGIAVAIHTGHPALTHVVQSLVAGQSAEVGKTLHIAVVTLAVPNHPGRILNADHQISKARLTGIDGQGIVRLGQLTADTGGHCDVQVKGIGPSGHQDLARQDVVVGSGIVGTVDDRTGYQGGDRLAGTVRSILPDCPFDPLPVHIKAAVEVVVGQILAVSDIGQPDRGRCAGGLEVERYQQVIPLVTLREGHMRGVGTEARNRGRPVGVPGRAVLAHIHNDQVHIRGRVVQNNVVLLAGLAVGCDDPDMDGLFLQVGGILCGVTLMNPQLILPLLRIPVPILNLGTGVRGHQVDCGLAGVVGQTDPELAHTVHIGFPNTGGHAAGGYGAADMVIGFCQDQVHIIGIPDKLQLIEAVILIIWCAHLEVHEGAPGGGQGRHRVRHTPGPGQLLAVGGVDGDIAGLRTGTAQNHGLIRCGHHIGIIVTQPLLVGCTAHGGRQLLLGQVRIRLLRQFQVRIAQPLTGVDGQVQIADDIHLADL